MISRNDTTILAVLSRYPDMEREEADGYINKIQHEENIPICHAVLGRIPREELDEESQTVFDEFQRWSTDRTRRTRIEQQSARRRQQETRLALKLGELHAQGVISDKVLLLYGISGELPERNAYQAMNVEDRERYWQERMESRLGPNWWQFFETPAAADPNTREGVRTSPFVQRRLIRAALEHHTCNWLKEGF